jgi:glutamine cyclotransferase
MKKWHLLSLLIITVMLVAIAVLLASPNPAPTDSASKPLQYTCSIVHVYPHDENAFTEGLVFDNGSLYESTGLYGNSTLRRVELETGKVLQLYSLPSQYFGEGITIFDDEIIQLTWRQHKGFVYDKNSFSKIEEFNYSTEGWGLTSDGSRLVMSDGTANLYFLDPRTFEKTGQIEVHDDGPVTGLNELEYINGKVYANVWQQEKIVVINPETGQVEAWINLSSIQNPPNQDPSNVLNGIAYDAKGDRLFVIGKNWSHLYEITLSPTTK